MIEGDTRCVVIANGAYVKLANLDRAVPDAEDLKETLEGKHRYPTEIFANFERGALLESIDDHLGEDALVDGSLIVVWIGHGTIGADHTLRLLVRSGRADREAAEAGKLGEWAARTGARQIMVVIDTCHSGAGILDATRLADAVNSGQVSPERRWFGAIAASLKDEPARSGALVRELVRLLREGPRKAELRWDRTRPYISGDDLMRALLEGWSEPRQRPQRVTTGQNWDFVHNPLFEPGVPDQPIEHLLLAARGGSKDESFFTGREYALTEIVKWIGRGTPGLFVLTGPPGCGKSAVAGRIVSLASSVERAKLISAAPIPETLDPGVGRVDGQLQARGHTVDTASEQFARQLQLDVDAGPYGILAEARRRRKEGDPLVLVVDGLDEAGAYISNLAVELIAPLAREALVLVATRDVPCGDKTLIAQLGPAPTILDLGEDVEGTRRDIAAYVKRRLAGVAVAMDSDLVAAQLAAGGGSNGPQFLLARLVTSQLREQPVDTASPGWRLALATTVESALERDLQSVVLTIAGEPHATAAREMIRALTLAHGGGFPADDLWPAVATAISPTHTVFTRDDTYKILEKFGRHLIAGSEWGQPVYRVAHQSLVDYVRGDATATLPSWGEGGTASAVANVILAEYDRRLDAGFGPRAHVYLWRHAWRHLAEAGASGLVGLRHLVERDREAFLPDLAAGLELASRASMSAGRATEALAYIKEAVEIRRRLPDELQLAMTLFSLTFVQAAAGDPAIADEAAAEAAKLARAAGGRPEGRAVLGAALVARAHSSIMNGSFNGALYLAREAIDLYESDEAADDEDAWHAKALAYSVMGRAAFSLEDFGTAAAMCQRAVDLVDAQRDSDQGADLQGEALSTLANIGVYNAVLNFPDETGAYRSALVPAASRVLDEYRRAGGQGTVADIAVSSGIQAYVRARCLDRVRGIESAEAEDLGSILRESIALARPFASEILVAAIILAESATLLLQLDPAGATAECAFAEQCLRSFTDSSDLAASVLGQLLSEANGPAIARVLQGLVSDASEIVDRQREAVVLLARSGLWTARLGLAKALINLSALLAQPAVDGGDEGNAVRSDAIDAWRGLLGKVPGAPAQLVALLCEQAGSLMQTRTGEAVDLAREAVALAGSLPQPQAGALAGFAHTNLGGALLVRAVADGLRTPGHLAEARDILLRAIEHLEVLAPQPVSAGVLAIARLNLAQVELSDGRFAEALFHAERAVALLDTPHLVPSILQIRPKVFLTLGQAQRRTGNLEQGTVTLRSEIAGLCAMARVNESGVTGLAGALNYVAPDFWDDVLENFADQPEVQRMLNIMRQRPPDEAAAIVDALLDGFDNLPTTKHRFLRQIARRHRAWAPEAFDGAWREKTGALPPWLTVDQAQEWLVIAWWNTNNWKLSRDYVKAHPTVLDPMTDIVIEEFALDGFDKGRLDLHRQLLDDCRARGAGNTQPGGQARGYWAKPLRQVLDFAGADGGWVLEGRRREAASSA